MLKCGDFSLFQLEGVERRTISVKVTSRCNYACAYCISIESRNNGKDDLNAVQLIKFLESLDYTADRPSVLSIIGGEPLLYKKLKDVITAFLDLASNNTVAVITNNSEPIDYWFEITENYRKRVRLSASFHSEYVTFEVFKDLCVAQREAGFPLSVAILIDADNYADAISLSDSFNASGIETAIRCIRAPHDTDQTGGLSEDQIEVLKTKSYGRTILVDGVPYQASQVPLLFDCDFYGFRCYKQRRLMRIDTTGDVYDSMIGCKQKIGHIDSGVSDPVPVICTLHSCKCLPNIESMKEKV